MEVIRQITAVAGVFGLLFAVLWWLRHRGFAQITGIKPFSTRQSNRRMERIEKLVLSPQHTLHLVRLGEIALVVAASPAGCSLIQTLPSNTVDGPVARQEAVR